MKEFTDRHPVMDRASGWTHLQTGQAVTAAEQGHPASAGTIDDITPDALILWVGLPGASPRRLFMCTDQVKILPIH
ncbi:hypothetical protein AB4089_18385 [Arthrobacter sp. 2MCAF15]|uniref:hypothetical protein n=1 Tax=Arthrobacter sp. 2MCAF15 TaxID=3232984 RepID=UPI003F92BC53